MPKARGSGDGLKSSICDANPLCFTTTMSTPEVKSASTSTFYSLEGSCLFDINTIKLIPFQSSISMELK